MRYLALFIINIIVPVTLIGQEVVVDPDDLPNVLDGDWDTYSGDYSGPVSYTHLTLPTKA